MPEYITIPLLFITGFFAGMINVTAGGGSSLTLPVLIFLGLDGALANGTNRVAIFVQNVSGILSFRKEKHSDFPVSIKLALFTLPGAVIGAITAVNISDELFKTILGIIMIGIIISMIIPRKNVVTTDTGKSPWYVYLFMVGIGFYGGFIQVGVGFILMAALHYGMKLNLVRVNMHKVFIVFIYTIPALVIFIISGNVNWFLGLSLAIGNASGAWFAAKLSVKKGEKFIRVILIATVFIMSLKLLGIF